MSTATAPSRIAPQSTVKNPRNHSKALWAFISIASLVVVWQILSVLLGKSPAGVQYLPGWPEVFAAFISFAGYWPGGLGAESTLTGAPPTAWGAILGLIYNTLISLARFALGYLAGMLLGIGLGLLISWSKPIRQLIAFPAHFARMMPLLAMLPLFGLWFGSSELGTEVFTAFAVAVLLFVITLNAVNGVSTFYRDYAASLGASKRRTYTSIVIPSIIPELTSGLLLAVPFAWSAVLAAEILGKQYGLGRVLNFALLYSATDVVAATALVVITIAAITYFVLKRVLDHITRWAR